MSTNPDCDKQRLCKPMLAPNKQVDFDSEKLEYPMFASHKLDGYRCLVVPQPAGRVGLYSRTYKTFANSEILREHFVDVLRLAHSNRVVFDCEIYSTELSFNELGSFLRKKGRKIPSHIKLYCFDAIPTHTWGASGDVLSYSERYKRLTDIQSLIEDMGYPFEVLDQVICKTPEEARSVFELYSNMGEEGIMLRSIMGRYKHGRATVNEGLIYKFKVSETADAQIVDILGGTSTKDGIEREVDEFGHRKFAGKKADRVSADRLGGIKVKLDDGTITKIGISAKFADEEFPDAEAIWKNRNKLIGKWVEFEFMPVGVKDKPRWGRLVRFRRDKDKDDTKSEVSKDLDMTHLMKSLEKTFLPIHMLKDKMSDDYEEYMHEKLNRSMKDILDSYTESKRKDGKTWFA